MKLLIYGAGIQGSFLTHSLMKGNNDVTLLARGKRKEELLTHGLVLHHSLQRKQSSDTVRVIESLHPDDYYDVIFVTMKYCDFPTVIDSLAKNRSSKIIFIGNQIDAASLEKEIQKKSVHKKKIYFGFQMTGGTNTDKGISVLRFGKGQLKLGSLHTDFDITTLLDTIFDGTNYTWAFEPNIDSWLKSHAVLIMVQNSFEYLYNFSAREIRKTSDLSQPAIALKEAFDLLEIAGNDLLPKGQKTFFSHPRLSKLFYTIYYRLPVNALVQGSFKEIHSLINTFQHYQTISSPQLDSLLRAAKEKYEKSQEQLSSAS
ncbi:hypothetical protein IGI39_000863 [Enterococcus sp. AZ135]|uniref:ketopantoate reductase family protein n=1 Tax=unclassified Enterococcus TaxID=2608891 RepID=UPI003F2425F3